MKKYDIKGRVIPIHEDIVVSGDSGFLFRLNGDFLYNKYIFQVKKRRSFLDKIFNLHYEELNLEYNYFDEEIIMRDIENYYG